MGDSKTVVGVDIRPATAADREDVLELLAVQLEEHDIVLGTERLAAAVDGCLADPTRGRIFVARSADGTIGVAYMSLAWVLEHGGRTAWLDELYVRPAHRERGVGTALLRAVLDAARAAGAAAVDLEVESSHARAAALYERHGFRRHQRTRYVLPLPPE